MRSILAILILILAAIGPTYISAQTPLGINYQGIARSGDGSPIVNQPIGLRMSITSGPDGSTDYREEHHVLTNEFGLFTVIVGNGQSGGSLNDVDWVAGNKWLQVEIDAQDIGNYMVVGSQQLLSVPYALFAAQSGDALRPGIGVDISNGRVNNVLPDQIVTLTGGGGTTVSGTYPNFSINSVDNVDDADADATNEIQTLTLNGTNLELSDGNSVDLAAFVNTDGQNLADVLAQGADANGAIITGLADPVVAQDAATKNYVDNLNAQDLDKDNSNEIQDLQLAANSLSITNNTSATAIDLSGYLDNTDVQNLSNVLGQNNDAGDTKITNLGAPTAPQDAATKGYVDNLDVQDLDKDNSNEIQDLQLTANSLSITNNTSATAIDLSGYLDNTDAQNLSNVLGVGASAGGIRITNVGDPQNIGDAVNLGYLEAKDAADFALSVPILFTSGGAGDVPLDLSSATLDKGGLITGNTITIAEAGVYSISVQGISSSSSASDIEIWVNGVATPVMKVATFYYIGQMLAEFNVGDLIQVVVRFSTIGETVNLKVIAYKI